MENTFEWDLTPKKEKGQYFIFDFLMVCVIILALAAYQSSNKIELERLKAQKAHNTTKSQQNPEKSKILPTGEAKTPKPTSQNTKFDEYSIAIWYLKSKEGFRTSAYLDGREWRNGKLVDRWSNGWGLRCKPWEEITLAKANKDLMVAFEKRYQHINKTYPNIPRWDKLILATIRYNVGSFKRHGLHDAIKTQDPTKIKIALSKYTTNSRGDYMKGLANRRKEDIAMLFLKGSDKDKIAVELKKTVAKKIAESEILTMKDVKRR